MKYGSGSASGVFATDNVTMGPYTVNQQGFGAYFFPIPSSPSLFYFLSVSPCGGLTIIPLVACTLSAQESPVALVRWCGNFEHQHPTTHGSAGQATQRQNE